MIGATLSTTDASYGSGKNLTTMDNLRAALLPLAAAFRLRGLEAKCELDHVIGRWVKYPQKSSEGASRWGEQALLDCPITKNRPEAALERAGRFIHHVQWQYPPHLDDPLAQAIR